jgi:hypothetical protein
MWKQKRKSNSKEALLLETKQRLEGRKIASFMVSPTQ